MAVTASGSNGGVKQLMLATFSSGLEEQMELEGRIIAGRAESTDGREGVDAFMAKRETRVRVTGLEAVLLGREGAAGHFVGVLRCRAA